MLALGSGITPAFANEKNSRKLDNAIEMLQGAKKASDPMPMLVSARNALNEANKGNKTGERIKAMEYVKAAIAELKTGDKKKMEEKINAAIANIQSGRSKVKSK
jgi:hypothetical protein